MKKEIQGSLKTNSQLFLIIFVLICILFACSNKKSFGTIQVEEGKGLERELEYVSVEIPLIKSLKKSEFLVATNSNEGNSIPVQVVDTVQYGGKSKLSLLFPVSIAANATNFYDLTKTDKISQFKPSKFQLSDDQLTLENKDYTLFFSGGYDTRGGQINGLVLKKFNDQLLKRGHISMHWAPNFSKTISPKYFNFENLPITSQNKLTKGIYQIVKNRSGSTDSVPEISLKGKYTFYSGLPYFNFESTMVMRQEVELDLLRNDEMTMDSLFTHVIYQKKDGKISKLKLYDSELNILEKNPIPDDASFVAFYHKDKKFGLGSIRLEYDNSNESGNRSPSHHAYTKISKSSGNGRYWNRVISDTIQKFPKGSRYREKNAYLIFAVDDKFPEKEILYYQDRLQHPLEVNINQ